jgi:hypothetical protein
MGGAIPLLRQYVLMARTGTVLLPLYLLAVKLGHTVFISLCTHSLRITGVSDYFKHNIDEYAGF